MKHWCDPETGCMNCSAARIAPRAAAVATPRLRRPETTRFGGAGGEMCESNGAIVGRSGP
jgi:hypothetical protein